MGTNNKTLGLVALAAGSAIFAKTYSTLKYWKPTPIQRKIQIDETVANGLSGGSTGKALAKQADTQQVIKQQSDTQKTDAQKIDIQQTNTQKTDTQQTDIQQIDTKQTDTEQTLAQQILQQIAQSGKTLEYEQLPQGNEFTKNLTIKKADGSEVTVTPLEILIEYQNLSTEDAEINIFGQSSISTQYRFSTPYIASYTLGTYRIKVDGVDYSGSYSTAKTPVQLAALFTALGMGTFYVDSTSGTESIFYVSNNENVFTELEIVNVVSGDAVIMQVDATATTTVDLTLVGTLGDTVTFDWGDGTAVTTLVFTGTPDNVTHTYAVPDVYDIAITGDTASVTSLTIASPVTDIAPAGTFILETLSVQAQGLATIDLNPFINVNLSEVLLNDNALSVVAVDTILSDLVTSTIPDGILDISGGTNGIPTGGVGNTDFVALVTDGWVVNINDTANEILLLSDNTATLTTTLQLQASAPLETITVDWGDTNSDIISTTGGLDSVTHVYGGLGEYLIQISGVDLDTTQILNVTTDTNQSISTANEFTALQQIQMPSTGLRRLRLRPLLGTTLDYIVLTDNALSQETVDTILADVVTSGIVDGVLDISGGTNAIPTGGIDNADYETLVTDGWQVLINDTTPKLAISSNNTAALTTTFQIQAAAAAQTINIDWGDGNTNAYVTTGGLDSMTHTYASLGNYIIKISGTNLATTEILNTTTPTIKAVSPIGAFTALTSLSIANAGLERISLTNLFGTTLTYVDLDANALTLETVDKILLDADNSGIINGVLGMGNGTSAVPTGGMLNANYLSLVGKGWFVFFNGMP